MNQEKKIIVISGVNLVEAGPLSVLKDCLTSIEKWHDKNITIIALVNNKMLFTEFLNGCITFLEYPNVKKRWINRIIFEYYSCFSISKKIQPDVWLALHDITPNVAAKKRIVYCHNPSPFYKLSFREAIMEKSLFAFSLLYKLLYRVNIKKNDFVIVQQQWIRDFFKKNYNLNNIIVAYPDVKMERVALTAESKQDNIYRFLYPAFPRVFKNFEVLFEAADKLKEVNTNFEILVTFTGNENKYATYLFNKYKHISQIKFIGQQTRQAVYKLYNYCDCLLFPSKLETWGLPITEMKMFEKPILVADCRYSQETVGLYDKVCFFNMNDHLQLKNLMQNAINNTLAFDKTVFTLPQQPFTQSWEQLFEYIL